MTSLTNEIEKFLLYDPEKNPTTVHLSLSQPTPLEARNFGRLFILTEITSRSPLHQELISLIQTEMERAYYHSTQVRLEAAFEQALEQVNRQLHQLIENGVTDWLDHFNIIIGVIKDKALIISHIGQLQANLIHRGRIVDVVSTAGPEERKLNPLKIFSNIISGEVAEDDYLVFFTPSLLDFLSQEKLKRIILDKPPSESVRQLEELLKEGSSQMAFAALLVHIIPSLESLPMAATIQSAATTVMNRPQSSMENLIARQQATNQILTPSLWLITKQFFRTMVRVIAPGRSGSRTGSLGPRHASPYSELRPKSAVSQGGFLKALGRGIVWITLLIVNGFAYLFNLIGRLFRRRDNIKSTVHRAPSRVGRVVSRTVFNWPRWSPTRKILSIALLILLFFFSQSIVSLGRKEESKLTASQREQTIRDIQDKVFQAEASMSYEDEARAVSLLNEASQLIVSLPNKSKSDQATVNRLLSEVEAVREKTRHLVNIESPAQLADLSGQAEFGGTEAISLNDQGLFLPDRQSGSLYQISIADQSVERQADEGNQTNGVRFGLAYGSQSIILYHQNDNLSEFLPGSATFRALEYAPANVDKSIAGLAAYQSRIYLLDTKNRQIFRYQRGNTTFGQAVAWLDQPSDDLLNAVSLAVDGSVYVLLSDGRLNQYTQGRLDDFSLAQIDPALTSAKQIWTDADSDFLYILDRDGRRLVVFTKTGALKQQYRAEAFDNLKAVAVDEANNKAYLLNGSRIYQIDLAD